MALKAGYKYDLELGQMSRQGIFGKVYDLGFLNEITWNISTTSQSKWSIKHFCDSDIQIFLVTVEIQIHKQLYLKAKLTMVIKGVQSLILSLDFRDLIYEHAHVKTSLWHFTYSDIICLHSNNLCKDGNFTIF